MLKAANDAQQSVAIEAKQLPPAVAAMLTDLGAKALGEVKGAASADLGRKYEEFVAKECRELIEAAVSLQPFEHAPDVPLDDFSHLFADGGTFDKFFKDNLASLVDTSRSPWRWKEGAAQVAGARGLLGQFQTVQVIREIYFKAGPKPEIRFNVTPDLLDAAVSRFSLDVDGQVLEYRHGPLHKSSDLCAWPGSGGVARHRHLRCRRGAGDRRVPGPLGVVSRLGPGQDRGAVRYSFPGDVHAGRSFLAAGARGHVGSKSICAERAAIVSLHFMTIDGGAIFRRVLRQAAL